MLFQRVALQISLVLIACSFTSAKYQLRNNTLYDDENKVESKNEFVKVMGYLCSHNDYNETIAEWLIDNGLEVNAENNLPIQCAARFGHLALVTKLLNDTKVDPAANGNQAIRWASEYGHLKVVKLLLKDRRVDRAANENESFRVASQNGHIEVVKLLLKMAWKGDIIILLASQSRHSEALKRLLEWKKVDVKLNAEHINAYYSENGYIELIKLLLKDESVYISANNTAIVYASAIGFIEAVELLLKDKRIDPSANQNQAIDAAADNGHAAVVELLLTNTSVNATNALEIAIDKKYYGIVAMINKARPDLVINEEVLKLANETIQVNTKFSIEDSKLKVHYESLKNYEATFVLSSATDESTMYFNVDTISKFKLWIELSKLRNSNEWKWRWICAKQAIESTGKFDLDSISTPDIDIESGKFPLLLIAVIVISASVFVGIIVFVLFLIRFRRLDKNAEV